MIHSKFKSVQFGQILRKIRQDKGLSVATLSSLMNRKFSASSISRREQGLLKVSTHYIEQLIIALKLSALEKDRLLGAIDLYSLQTVGDISERFKSTAEIKKTAVVVRNYQPVIIPVELQTLEYARAIIRSYNARCYRSLAKTRILSANRIMCDPSKTIYILISENSLYTSIGSDVVMLAQLSHLLSVKLEENHFFRISPSRVYTNKWIANPFVILDNSSVIFQNFVKGSIYNDKRLISSTIKDFDIIFKKAVGGGEAKLIIERAINHFKGKPS